MLLVGGNGESIMKKIPDPTNMKRITGPRLSKSNLKNAKIRITTYLDQDVLCALRQLAAESGDKYQSVLNQILRQSLLEQKNSLMARLTRLEKAVFRNKAA